MQEEIWKDIPGYEGIYQVSDLGRVRSLDRIICRIDGENRRLNGVILRPGKSKDGYLRVILWRNGKSRSFLVHQLVMISFDSHTPSGHKSVIDHINGDKDDNRLENLRLTSNRINTTLGKKNKWGLTGVVFRKDTNKWYSKMTVNKSEVYLGLFNTPADAHAAYARAISGLNE